MLQESVRQSLNCRMLMVALFVLAQDLSSRGGAQAWTYNYSLSPERDWDTGRQWCQQHFTDIVAIQNQEETDYLNNFLPKHKNYYWIGLHREKNRRWTWVGTKEIESKDNPNWATGEPDRYARQDCVEMYIKRDKDTGKWNNEKCTKAKAIVCYTVSCKEESCSAHADCLETIGNYTCRCHPGFMGPRCEKAISCEPLLDPEQGSHSCLSPFGPNHFNSSCRFNCERGFRLVGVPQLRCQAGGSWNHPVPLCQVEQCPVLNISGGNSNCSHPIAPYSYNSTCEVRCDKGYGLSGQDHIRCDHTGQWTADVPTCTVRKCPRIFFPAMGNMTCADTVEPFSYGSECSFTCQEGFYLTGENRITCLASGQWSKPTPECAVVKCNSLKIPPHASMQCQETLSVHSYGSVCTVHCEEGFDLIGTNMTKCLSQGQWSHALPVCQAKRCPTLISPPHGDLVCSDPNGALSFKSQCRTTCEEGFIMNGTADTECTSEGTWSTDIPSCLVKTCPTLRSPVHGSIACSNPHGVFSFGSQCNSTCDEGFVLNGTAETECTSVGTWSTLIPRCLAKTCPTLKSPAHGSIECSEPHGVFSFGSQCNSTCEEGFVLNGTAEMECTSVGAWSTKIPHCYARSCPLLVEAPQHGTMNCSHPHSSFSYGSHCDFKCNEGFQLSGTPTITCNTSGDWSQDLPTCQVKRCPTLKSPAHGSIACSDPHGAFSFGSQCNSTCDNGFVLNGTAETECTSVGTWSTVIPRCLAKTCPTLKSPAHGSIECSEPHGVFSFGSQCNSTCEEGFVLNGTAEMECTSVGAWSTEIPHCNARSCPLLVEAPQHGTMNCSHPHSSFSYGSHCDFKCNEGFQLSGTPTIACNTSGDWSQDLPTCQVKRCPTLKSPAHGSIACSDPHGAFSFGSHCTFTCEEGFVLNGTADTECTSADSWSRETPSCLARPCPLLAKAPQHGRMNCRHSNSPFSYGSRCDFECNEGFWLAGTSALTCNTLGHWSQDIPTCKPVLCEAFHALSSPLSMNCSHTLGNFSFGSQCLFTCKEGLFLNGSETLFCSSTGFWSDTLPICTGEGIPFGTAAMLLYTGAATASAVVPLALIGLVLLIVRKFKKRKESSMIISYSPAYEERDNPTFEL